MLTREQLYTMLLLRHREDNIFSVLPNELINHIGNINNHPDKQTLDYYCKQEMW